LDIFEKCYNYTDVKHARENGYYPYFKAIHSGAESYAIIDGKRLIMIGSNNYLGLTQHEHVKEAAIKAVEKFGSGCTGSRFLNGTLELHEELEDRLAKFMRRERALVFSTGFQSNLGTISTLAGKKDIIVADRENHASIVDGTRLSFGKTVKYRHNDMEDLERVLAQFSNEDSGLMIATDGVFSMGGDIVDLPTLVKHAKKYGARVFVDDAHAVGVLGECGRGTANHFGLDEEVDITMGTFSKSFATLGGFIVGDDLVIDYIKHHARALIFSASMPPAGVASTIAALDIMESEPERIEKLWENTHKMKKGYTELGFNTGVSTTPIIPVIIGDFAKTLEFWRLLFEAGVFVNPVISPAVPPGMELLRTSYMATHTDEMLDEVLNIFEKIGKQLGIIE
jgi:8-amino-7-oxononanoate synthase